MNEDDLQARLGDGGKVFGAFIVAKAPRDIEVHVSCDWLREPGCRTALVVPNQARAGGFRTLDEAWAFIQATGYSGVIPIYPVSAYAAPQEAASGQLLVPETTDA
jgi:hypothetical protein